MGGIGTRIGCTHCGYEADTLYEVKSHHCYTKGAPMTDKFELIERLGLQAFDPRYALATTRKVVDAAELEALLQKAKRAEWDNGDEVICMSLKSKDERVSKSEIDALTDKFEGRPFDTAGIEFFKMLMRIKSHGLKE
jgi:hypothetical protein